MKRYIPVLAITINIPFPQMDVHVQDNKEEKQ
jgi:small-conductance mechanosensitive channel